MPLQKFNTLAKQTAEQQDPLYRLFAREGSIGRKLLDHVRRDLQDIIKVCQGELKQTNHLRTLMSALTKGIFYFYLPEVFCLKRLFSFRHNT